MKVIAMHLPQYHEIEENNLWWGKGFTEWTRVKAARPLFKGHDQPRIPLNKNYYDLSVPGTLERQAALAAEYGVYGFCFYHYWFKGKQLLEKPVDAMLKNKTPDFPFCFSWANEPWTRAWNEGGEKEILMPQEYGDEADWEKHFSYLLLFFKDPRYIRIGNKPLFLIYRAEIIPDCDRMLEFLNKKAVENGFEGIHFVRTMTCFTKKRSYTAFSSEMLFEPGYTMASDLPLWYWLFKRIRKMLKIVSHKVGISCHLFIDKHDYDFICRRIVKRKYNGKMKNFYGLFCDWDNSPRRMMKNSTIFKNSTPKKFECYLQALADKAEENDVEFIFINAWNEWAEGTYLEPDEKNGYGYLEAVKNVVNRPKKRV